MDQSAQFKQLFSEFQQSYLASEGVAELAAYIEIRNSAYHNVAFLREQFANGTDCTDLILRRLLPYADTANNRWLGAWTHVAAAVPGDIRRWYGTAGRTGQEDWPIVAEAIWQLVLSTLDSPECIAEACQEFAQSPVAKGFQMGMLTPILNALQPEQFHLVNHRTRHVLQYFTGKQYPSALTNYPQTNHAVQTFLEQMDEQLVPFHEGGTYPGDTFERFCYWLTSIRRYSLKPARFWLIAAGEDAWQWEEWKDGGFVAVGWDELGDLSEIKKVEFTRRQESLLAQYDGWTKKETAMVWRFARQLKEGDQLAIVSNNSVILGYGSIVGSYYYAAELPQGHRIPVHWEDIQTRQLPADLGFNTGLMELTAPDYHLVQQASLQPRPVVSTGYELEAPPFVDYFVPLLEQLRATRKGASTADLVAQIKQNTKQAIGKDIVGEQPGKPSPDNKIESAIHRARYHLSKAGLIDSPRRGQWQVTAYGEAISLEQAEMARIYHEVEYHRRVEESLLHESIIIRRLTESSTHYSVDSSESYDFGSYNSESPAAVALETDGIVAGKNPVSEPSSTIDDSRESPRSGFTSQQIAAGHPYTLADCAFDTGFAEADLNGWVRTLRRKRQVILYGPSGTGKTYLAHRLANYLSATEQVDPNEESRKQSNGDEIAMSQAVGFWELVQFHPGYAYEDFVQGLRPAKSSKNGASFIMKPGRFLDFCQRAEACIGPAVLIIDEINRANLARVFGELMYLLEYRDAEAILAGNGARFQIPPNVYLIGTMNTADRSIALIDHALRRRFGFIHLRPNYDVLRHYHQRHQSGFDVEPLILLLAQINQSITDADHALGITYFLSPTLSMDLQDIWQTEIEPTLAERFFDNPEQIERYRWHQIANML